MLRDIDVLYSLAIDLSQKVVKNRIAFIDIGTASCSIYLYANNKLKAGVRLFKFNDNFGDMNNPNLKSVPIYELTTFVSKSHIDALTCIVLIWKLVGAIIPDQISVSGEAALLINNYYNRYKDNPKLIQPINMNDREAFRSVYLPNSSLFSMVSDIEIVEKPKEIGENLSWEQKEKQFNRLFNKKYDPENGLGVVLTMKEEHKDEHENERDTKTHMSA